MKKAGEITYTTVNRSKTGEGYELYFTEVQMTDI